MAIHPILKSAIAIGATSGTAYGALTQGETLEAHGAPLSQQVTGALGTGAIDGAIGAGAGLVIGGTAMALAKILRK